MCLLQRIVAFIAAFFVAFFNWLFGIKDTSMKPLAERIGVAYWGARYEPFLAEYGSGMASAMAELKRLGVKVTKLSTLSMEENYPFDDWSDAPLDSLVDVMKHPVYKQFLDDPFFTTYFFSAYETNNVVWWDGLSEEEEAYVVSSFYDATYYLMKQYEGTKKIFILQNWEADNALSYVYDAFPETAIQGMTDYFNARQKGIEMARDAVGMGGVYVFGGIEVNCLRMTPPSGAPRVADAIVPNTEADLYLYSCWETKDKWDIGDNGEQANIAATVTEALAYLNEKAPASLWFGRKNVAISEFGYPEMLGERAHPEIDGDAWQKMVVQAVVEAGIEYGAQYMVYWALYCNAPCNPIPDLTQVVNEDMDGYWLIRPDRTESGAYGYIKSLL